SGSHHPRRRPRRLACRMARLVLAARELRRSARRCPRDRQRARRTRHRRRQGTCSMSRDEWNALVDRARASDMIKVAETHGAELRKCGGEYVGACPVCRTGRDRFAIRPAKQLFNCRVCNVGGFGPIDLEMFLGGSDFVTAVKELTNTTSL